MRPGAYLVDTFPWLKYLPWYGRELRQGFIEDRALYRRHLDATKRQMVRSPHSQSMTMYQDVVHRTTLTRGHRLPSFSSCERLTLASTRLKWRSSLVPCSLVAWTLYVV